MAVRMYVGAVTLKHMPLPSEREREKQFVSACLNCRIECRCHHWPYFGGGAHEIAALRKKGDIFCELFLEYPQIVGMFAYIGKVP